MSRLIDIPGHAPKSRKGTLAQWRMRLASSAANSRLKVGDLIAQSPLWAQHGGCHNHVFKPELSLAQKMSDHFGINVHAFLRRSDYGDVLRDKPQSESISSTLNTDGTSYVLEGGTRQIVLNPADLEKGMTGKRLPTHWGYDDFDKKRDLVGVPALLNNWDKCFSRRTPMKSAVSYTSLRPSGRPTNTSILRYCHSVNSMKSACRGFHSANPMSIELCSVGGCPCCLSLEFRINHLGHAYS